MITKCGTDIFQHQETDLWSADLKLRQVDEKKPSYHWKGPKIPIDLLWKFVAFARKAHELKHGEVQARLMLSSSNSSYHWLVYPQQGSGASTRELSEHPDRAAANAEIPKDCIQVGTIHSHPGFSAFQSGTDNGDSLKQDGLHVTVGWKSDTEHELSLTVTAYETRFETTVGEWFALDPMMGWEKQPKVLQDAALNYWALQSVESSFPEVWLTRLVKEVPFQAGQDLSWDSDFNEPAFPEAFKRRLDGYIKEFIDTVSNLEGTRDVTLGAVYDYVQDVLCEDLRVSGHLWDGGGL